MPVDISPDIYRYLARDWGLRSDTLTDKKCAILRTDIPILRKAYQAERRIPYDQAKVRRAYLAAFAPRYAYILYHCLSQVRTEAKAILSAWDRSEGVVCLLGGGPACEVYGLVNWLDEQSIHPRYLRVVMFDREAYWRSFHNFLFSDLIAKQFRTMIIPSYEMVDFPVSTSKRFDRTTVNYNFAQTSLIAEARLVSVVNCLSEMPDHRGFECQLRFLTRLAWDHQLLVCADSVAKKRRPRIGWVKNAFENARNFASNELFNGSLTMDCSKWMPGCVDHIGQNIFSKNGAPKWENSVKRWIHIRQTG